MFIQCVRLATGRRSLKWITHVLCGKKRLAEKCLVTGPPKWPILCQAGRSSVITAKPWEGLDPTGDRSYPPWNHVPHPQEIMHGTDAALDRMAYIYFKYTSHIILTKVMSKTLSPLWRKSFFTFFGGRPTSQTHWRGVKLYSVTHFALNRSNVNRSFTQVTSSWLL